MANIRRTSFLRPILTSDLKTTHNRRKKENRRAQKLGLIPKVQGTEIADRMASSFPKRPVKAQPKVSAATTPLTKELPGSNENDGTSVDFLSRLESKQKTEHKSEMRWYRRQPMKVHSSFQFEPGMEHMIAAPDFWHKFIIVGAADLERTVLLKAFLKAVDPNHIVPVLYRVESRNATFLARDCTAIIFKLFKSDFKLSLNEENVPNQIVLEVILCFQHVGDLNLTVEQALVNCVATRYRRNTCTLDLSDFAEDPDLVETVYCPLWLPKIFLYVVNKARALNQPIVNLILKKNDLTFIKMAQALREFRHLRMVDLSENKLDSLNCLNAFQSLQLTELWLDKNPLCASYAREDYAKEVCVWVPTLKKLDGVILGIKISHPQIRNYTIPEASDLVDQFMERFFTIYDSENRVWLRGLYHQQACFSLSTGFLPGQSTSKQSSTHQYDKFSRNLLKISDYDKSYTLLNHGPDQIVATLAQLPRTEHDPYSFCVDVVHYTGNCAVLTVSGVFREFGADGKPLVRSFSRSFVLTWVGNMQYQICNEMIHISNVTADQARVAFKIQRPIPCLTKLALTKFESLTQKEQDKMTERMAELTEMNLRWSRRCLEESKWQFREALAVFTELLKFGKIPDEAFVKR